MVQAEAHSRLRNSGYQELRLVSCDFHEGVLTLRGQVSSFFLKQVAQELNADWTALRRSTITWRSSHRHVFHE